MGTDPVREQIFRLTRSRILLQYTWGPGTARYVNDLVGQGPTASESDHWRFQLGQLERRGTRVTRIGSCALRDELHLLQLALDNNAGQPATTYEQGKYLAGSLWWIPIARMSFGIEYMWGQRENLDGEDARARRLDGLFQYNF